MLTSILHINDYVKTQLMKNVSYVVPVFKTAIPGFKSRHLNRCIIIPAEQLLAVFTTAGVAEF